MYEYRATVLRVVDGDTLHVDIDLGVDTHVRQTIRLFGLNAPEMSTPEGEAAKAYVEGWIATWGPSLLLVTSKDKREKYGRYLGTVYGGGHCLNEDLLGEGHAHPYTGGKR